MPRNQSLLKEYPAMLLRILNFIDVKGGTMVKKFLSSYKFAIQIENRKILQYYIMRYINFLEKKN